MYEIQDATGQVVETVDGSIVAAHRLVDYLDRTDRAHAPHHAHALVGA